MAGQDPGVDLLVDGRDPGPERDERAAEPERLARDTDLARIGHDRAGEDPDERGLAGAIGADEPVHLPGPQLEVDPGQRLGRRVVLAQAVERDHGPGRRGVVRGVRVAGGHWPSDSNQGAVATSGVSSSGSFSPSCSIVVIELSRRNCWVMSAGLTTIWGSTASPAASRAAARTATLPTLAGSVPAVATHGLSRR